MKNSSFKFMNIWNKSKKTVKEKDFEILLLIKNFF